ncbi:MAG: hypothetical protein ACRDRO_08675 [Pseudonocardiaceae bacterium]
MTNDTVADAPVFDAIRPQVVQALTADGLIAHNAHVDVGCCNASSASGSTRKSSTL